MRRKYESEDKPTVALEGKRGKGKVRAQACTPDHYSGIEPVNNVQYQTTASSFSEGSQQSTVQTALAGEYPPHAAVSVDVYEVYCHIIYLDLQVQVDRSEMHMHASKIIEEVFNIKMTYRKVPGRLLL
jgi:hypothetical protein